MRLKVHISPHASQSDPAGGIGRVVAAQYRYLPECEIDLVPPERADLIACHISQHSYGLNFVDILHCHGLYWTGDPGSGDYTKFHHRANAEIVETARCARAITVPSRWVARPFERDMRILPEIIGHGIDYAAWQPVTEPGSYLLWNKNRALDVCDPTPAVVLAERGIPVVTTFVKPRTPVPDGLRITGKLPYSDMVDLIRGAGIYLATTPETFGISTLESMAAGVPILGYNWGGTASLIEHKWTGWLVDPGDINGLAEGYAWLMERRGLISDNCREAAKQYDWPLIISRYADLYRRVYAEKQAESSGVSVVITNHNYGRYVGNAIRSAAQQTIRPAEIIVIDDGSTDDSQDVIQSLAGEIPLVIRTQVNQGVASARNAGLACASHPYVVCLDADDELHPSFIEATLPALQRDRGLGIAYTGIKLLWSDGRETASNFPPDFDWDRVQSLNGSPPPTCIPSAALFRRDMWLRAGGWEQEWAPGEDTEFWTRALSVGFRAAKVSQEPLFRYRLHDGSASRTKVYRPIDTWHPWMRDKMYPMGAPSQLPCLVRSYSRPSVSIIIPVGPGHRKYLPEALRSVLGQTFRNWECIIIDDTGEPPAELWELLRPYPFVAVYFARGKQGAGTARNIGIKHAVAPYLLFLDADDYLMPLAIESLLITLSARADTALYAYSDWYAVRNGQLIHDQAQEYGQLEWFRRGFHAVTVLMRTEDARGVGGFDEELVGWEDYDFFLRLAVSGVCGVRCPEPLLAYRQELGTRREESLTRKSEITTILEQRYGAFRDGGRRMAGCCGGNGRVLEEAKQHLGMMAPHPVESPPAQSPDQGIEPPARIRMEFIGEEMGAITFRGPSGQVYRGGANAFDRYANVLLQDVEYLEQSGKWRKDPRLALQQRMAIPHPSPPPALDRDPLVPASSFPSPQARDMPDSEARLTPRDLILDDTDTEAEAAAAAADKAVQEQVAKRKRRKV